MHWSVRHDRPATGSSALERIALDGPMDLTPSGVVLRPPVISPTKPETPHSWRLPRCIIISRAPVALPVGVPTAPGGAEQGEEGEGQREGPKGPWTGCAWEAGG